MLRILEGGIQNFLIETCYTIIDLWTTASGAFRIALLAGSPIQEVVGSVIRAGRDTSCSGIY